LSGNHLAQAGLVKSAGACILTWRLGIVAVLLHRAEGVPGPHITHGRGDRRDWDFPNSPGTLGA
jgi:hypothetical protein